MDLQYGLTHTGRKASGDLPMGMTTPKTATVRFSPRRKCSLPAEEMKQESDYAAVPERIRERKCGRTKGGGKGEAVAEEGDKTGVIM